MELPQWPIAKVRFKRFEGKDVRCELLYPGINIVGEGYIENRHLVVDCANDGVSFVTDVTTRESNSEWGPSTIGGVKMRPGYYYEFTTSRKLKLSSLVPCSFEKLTPEEKTQGPVIDAATSQPAPQLPIKAWTTSTPKVNVKSSVVRSERHTPQLDDSPTQPIWHRHQRYTEDRPSISNTLSMQSKTQSLEYFITENYEEGTDSEPAATLIMDPESPPGPYSSNPMPVPFPDRLPAGYQIRRRYGCTMKKTTSRIQGSPEQDSREAQDSYDHDAPTQIIDTPLFLEGSMSPEIPSGAAASSPVLAPSESAARSREGSTESSSQMVSQVYSVTASTQQILHQHGHVPSTPLELLNDDRDNMSVQSQDEEQQVPVKTATIQYAEATQAATRPVEEQTTTEHTEIEQEATEQTEEEQAVAEYTEEGEAVIEREETQQATAEREVAGQMAVGRIEATQSSEDKQYTAMSDVSTLEHDLPPSPLPESMEDSFGSQGGAHEVENKDDATLNEPQRRDEAITNRVGSATEGHEFEPCPEQGNAQSTDITSSTATPRRALTRQSSRTSYRSKGGSSKHGMESDSGVESSSKPSKLIKTESVDESLSLSMRGRQTSVPRMYSTRSDLDQGKLGVLISAPGLSREEKNNLIHMLKDFRAEHKEDDYKDAAVLVFASSSRTWKLMCAIVLGLPIVTLDWLKQSSAQGKRLPFSDYVFHDPVMEENYNFKLADSCQLAQTNRDRNLKLFKDYTFYFVTETSKTQKKSQDLINKGFITSTMVTETLTPMVEVCGGKVVRTKPKDSDKGNRTIVIGPDAPCVKTQKLVEKGFHVMKREFILSTILKQHLDFSKQHMIFLETSTDDEDDNADADVEDEDGEKEGEEEGDDDTNDKAYEDEGTESETTASTKASARRKTPSKAPKGRSVRATSVVGNRRSRKGSVDSVTQAATSSSSAPKLGPLKGRTKGSGSTRGRSTKEKATRKKS
ncbi:Mediator of DNA damage checkpoint protein 1 [Mortierella polycephala]|uniref:Mediator of DNA damage checkpoint protein 1 n=1 Tax=Mortierella polycephala TaxID=41804 RepID=A0A9P6U2Q6_9FUNG|nr:Mediator of DNA damage checkpoint protein 1 [Mortierella polycephala]